MLTDIFARRYQFFPLRDNWYEQDRRFMTQAVMMIGDLFGLPDNKGKLPPSAAAAYRFVHDIVAREIGFQSLSSRWWWDAGKNAHEYGYNDVCKNFLTKAFDNSEPADSFVKDRLSLVEQAFHHKWVEVHQANVELPNKLKIAGLSDFSASNIINQNKIDYASPLSGFQAAINSTLPTNRFEGIRNANVLLNAHLHACISELNERLRLALYPLHFHNGLIQVLDDGKITEQIHEPFWLLVKDPIWANVEYQMKEALDRRDAGDRTAAFHAVSALESAIKIISDEKGWSTGKENGAANYVENLGSKANGQWLAQWECELLKKMFSDVRNPFAHGPGKAKMPSLSAQQTNWAIDTAMSWTKSLINRL